MEVTVEEYERLTSVHLLGSVGGCDWNGYKGWNGFNNVHSFLNADRSTSADGGLNLRVSHYLVSAY